MNKILYGVKYFFKPPKFKLSDKVIANYREHTIKGTIYKTDTEYKYWIKTVNSIYVDIPEKFINFDEDIISKRNKLIDEILK